MDNNFVKIVGYDAEGNAHVLFGIENDKTTEEKSPMPSLETGMFIRLEFNGIKETEIGFVYIENAPIVDTVPVVHGKWIPVTNGRGGSECNMCHAYAPSYQSGTEYNSPYCPNCGAKMDGGADNG